MVAAGGTPIDQAPRPGLAGHDRGLHPPQGQLRHADRARPGVTDRFYLDTLARFVAEGVVAPDRSVPRRRAAARSTATRSLAAGFTDVVITNLDERMDVYNEYAPYEWRHEDAEALSRRRRQRRLGPRPPRPAPLRLAAPGAGRAAAGRAQGRHRLRGARLAGGARRRAPRPGRGVRGDGGGGQRGPLGRRAQRAGPEPRVPLDRARGAQDGAVAAARLPARHPLRLRAAPADRSAGPEPAGAAGGGGWRRSSSGWHPARATSSPSSSARTSGRSRGCARVEP